jgi:sterol desaturase/sphingolipid hydroxylase (fatty acid hydroxylase superfamily)
MVIPIIVFVVGVVMVGCELARPGRSWPRVAGWWLRAALLNGFQVAMIYVAGVAWDGWMVRHRPWSADALGVAGGALLGYFVLTFVYYWWHRFRHQFDFLWRWFHQVHHSPQRIEVITAFYKHPFEVIANVLISSTVSYLVVGLDATAAAYAMLLSGLAELFYHWNVPTPHWLGYLLQRPESHCVHHQEGVHSYNYGDLPLWDMLFGTFRNPRRWEGRCGFGSEPEHQLVRMLVGKDVNKPAPAGAP